MGSFLLLLEQHLFFHFLIFYCGLNMLNNSSFSGWSQRLLSLNSHLFTSECWFMGEQDPDEARPLEPESDVQGSNEWPDKRIKHFPFFLSTAANFPIANVLLEPIKSLTFQFPTSQRMHNDDDDVCAHAPTYPKALFPWLLLQGQLTNNRLSVV